jgi:phosphoglycolate phosphatase
MLAHAFIFDLDGTLVDSLQDITAALNAALEDHRLPTAAADQVKAWVGDGLRSLCRRAYEGSDGAVLKSLQLRAAEHYARRSLHWTKPYPNILTMLNLLATRGARMAVLSNKPHELTVEVVRGLRLESFFLEVSGLRVEEDRKPAPATALRIAQHLGSNPAEVLLVGDSVVDIQTARNAGMKIAAVTWGFRPEEEIRAAGPDYLVHDPLEIVRIGKK